MRPYYFIKCVHSRMLVRELARLVFLLGIVLFVCEYAIYHIVMFQCSWPSQPEGAESNDPTVVKAMFLADTHLLGPYKGHWFDKLKREWQMYRAFQTAVGMFNPEVIFFLGDLFDEGEWVRGPDFNTYVNRFASLFSVPDHIDIHVVPGNHDIGFHYATSPVRDHRFRKAFNTSAVRLLTVKDVNFVLLNSMAMEFDDCYCFLCEQGMRELLTVEGKLSCLKDPTPSKYCPKSVDYVYNSPILLQHFPMYRNSDAMCEGIDTAPEDEKSYKFRPSIDCLTKDSTKMVLEHIQPRLVMSGHTHHYCLVRHSVKSVGDVPEYSVPSFSFRNRNNPSFFLGHFTKTEFHLSKCFMPQETTVNTLYILGAFFLLFLCIRHRIRRIFVYLSRWVWS